MKDKELSAWLSLCMTPELSNKNTHLLLQHFTNAAKIFDEKLSLDKNLGKEVLGLISLCRARKANPDTNKKIQQALQWRNQKQHHLITLHCDTYPPLLKEIPDPPLLLYVVGSLAALCLPQIAIVGSRKASPGGKVMAKRLAENLVRYGYAICSGMALGIDSEGHQGALTEQGISVAVLGCGIDQIYPRSNARLAKQLAARGALVSEFPLGTPPKPWHFPQRNRIISGLSQGVVVVEAALKSGSLITARYALEQGREVFAVPGSPHNPQAKGSHYLLKSGAKLVENASDVIEELGAFINIQQKRRINNENPSTHLNKAAQTLLKHIDYEVTNIDLLIHQTGINAEHIASLLIELELAGLIISRPGGYSLSPA